MDETKRFPYALWGFLFMALMISPLVQAEETSAGKFQWLDKVTARISDFTLSVDETKAIGPLSITLYHCDRSPPEEPPESTAFVKINENQSNIQEEQLLSGWIFASSPAVHSLEHPVYDIWLVECINGLDP